MKLPQRAAVLLAVLGVAAGVLFGTSTASAYPAAPATQFGSVTYNFIDPAVATITQSSASAVVLFSADNSLDIAANETLNFVQSVPSQVMIIRYTGASPIEWHGTVTASANLIVTSAAGFIIDGIVTTGVDLVLTTGVAQLDGAGNLNPVFNPTALDGGITVDAAATLTAQHNLGIAGDRVDIDGSLVATDGSISVASTSQANYTAGADGAPLTIGAGLTDGFVDVSSTGSVRGHVVVEVTAQSPSGYALDGVVESDGRGEVLATASVFGVGGGDTGHVNAFADSNGVGDGTLGAHLFGAAPSPFVASSVQVSSLGQTVPAGSAAGIMDGIFFEELDASLTLQCVATDDDAPAEPSASMLVGNLAWDGDPVLPGGFDLGVPNQAPLVIPGLGTVAVNVQEWSVVDGYQILTATALRVVSGEVTTDIGVAECGWPNPAAAPAGLPATGLDAGQLILALGAGGALIVLGVFLYRRRSAVR